MRDNNLYADTKVRHEKSTNWKTLGLAGLGTLLVVGGGCFLLKHGKKNKPALDRVIRLDDMDNIVGSISEFMKVGKNDISVPEKAMEFARISDFWKEGTSGGKDVINLIADECDINNVGKLVKTLKENTPELEGLDNVALGVISFYKKED